MSNYGSRKFILAVLVFVTSTLLLVFGFLDKEYFYKLVSITVGAYILGNVSQKAVEAKNAGAKTQ